MNREKLREAEERFLAICPLGFWDPAMLSLGKKHKMAQMVPLAQESFAEEKFSDLLTVAENLVKIVSRSSMVSIFEKPKFREGVFAMDSQQLQALANGLRGFLHGNQQEIGRAHV